MTKYVLRINKPLKDLDDDEMLLLLIVPARMKGETYTLLSRNSDGFGKIVPYHTHDLMNWCYLAGRAFETSIALYQLFKAEEFWDRDQEGPNDDEIMRAVLAYALRPNSSEMRTRAEKMATVLEHFSKERVDPEKIVRSLKSGGGVDRFYQRVCRDVATADGKTTAAPKAALREPDHDQSDSAKD